MKIINLMLLMILVTSNAVASCLDEVATFSERICGEIQSAGVREVTEASGELKAEVSGIIRKVVGDAGGSINVKHLTESYDNVLIQDLPGDKFNARDCRIKMVEVAREEACVTKVVTPPQPVCTYVSIKSLGWSSGHKTNYCKANGYPQGNFNQGEYKNGGICMSGESSICEASVLGQLAATHYCQPEGSRTVCYKQ